MKYFYTTQKLSENMHETPEGFLVCVGVPIARTGEMVYGEGETPLEVGDDGTIVISREEKDVFNPKTMASFEGKPVTITHPTEFVTPQNWSRLAKGVVQNVRRGTGDSANDLIADLLVTDQVAINLIKNGLREVSCGYEAIYTDTGDGEGKQSRIIGNHLALVDEGRAGSSYAINDHKAKGVGKMKLQDKIKAIFGKAQDEAAKLVADAEAEGGEKKEDKAKDADGDKAGSYDELCKMVKDLGEQLSAMKPKAQDAEKDAEEKPAPKKDDKEEKAKDEESGAEASMEDRMKALEASVAKILESLSAEAGDEDGEEMEESEDADEMEESEDDDFEESTMTGDTASRVEILAPGLKAQAKDAKAAALKVAYATKDGKRVIDALTSGKAPNYDQPAAVDSLFMAASEVLKVQRTSALSKTKHATFDSSAFDTVATVMTAEKVNELHAKHYNKK